MIKYPTGTEIREAQRKQFEELQKIGIKTSEIGKKPRKAKFNNKKYVLDGYKFDSGLEMSYYQYLKNLKLDFKVHEKFTVHDAFKCHGKHERAITYTPDFVRYQDGELLCAYDTKGGKATQTDASSLRMKLFMSYYDVPLYIVTWDKDTQTFVEKQK